MSKQIDFNLETHIQELSDLYQDQDFLTTVAPYFKYNKTKYALFLTAINYYKPHQLYHNFNHAVNVVKAVITIYNMKKSIISTDVLIASIWHDAIYVPGSDFSEQLSSDAYVHETLKLMKLIMGNEELTLVDANTSSTKMIVYLIKNTTIKQHLKERERYGHDELNILLDADLSSLAIDDYNWFTYNQSFIVKEQIGKGIPTDEDFAKCKNFLGLFIEKENIYRTSEGYALWETKARNNIEKYINGV